MKLLTEPTDHMSQGLTVWLPVDGAPVEGHDVLGQGASLVWEDVFNLPQLLVQGGGSSLGWSVTLSVVHLSVPVNVVAVAQPEDLNAVDGPIKGTSIRHIKIKASNGTNLMISRFQQN